MNLNAPKQTTNGMIVIFAFYAIVHFSVICCTFFLFSGKDFWSILFRHILECKHMYLAGMLVFLGTLWYCLTPKKFSKD